MTVLGVTTLDKVTVDQLLDALNPENPLERIVYRKQVAQGSQSRREFVRLKNKEVQVAHEKISVANPNPKCCFKNLRYSVVESSGAVRITLQKHCEEPMKIRVRTEAGSAKSPEDYTEMDDILLLEKGVCEHEISVKVLDDEIWEPDKEFSVQICDCESG